MTLPAGAFQAPYTYAGLTDIGRVRKENQDRWLADAGLGLYLVADGMGGGFGGGLAAQVVVDTLPGLLRKRLGDVGDLTSAVVDRVKAAVAELSNKLLSESSGKPGLDGMGSTVVLAFLREDHALVAHLGDSRAYLQRDGKLRRLTRDHSIIQLLLDAGELDPREVEGHPARGQITQFVGMESEPLPEVAVVGLRAGDRLLLCSDGLYGMVTDDALHELLLRHDEPEAACRALVEAANAAGGSDNVTALVVALREDAVPSGSRAEFPLTAWSVIIEAQVSPSAQRRAALEKLVERYWKPIYAYFRSQGKFRDDAEDLTQAFLLDLIEGNSVRTVTPERGRFRDWLRACLRNFLHDQTRREHARKRRPREGLVSLEALAASDGRPFEPGESNDPDKALDDAWLRDLLDRALRAVADRCVLKGRTLDYQVFIDYYCRQEPQQATWQELAARHSLAEWKQAARKADWVKRQLALAIRAEVARYADTEEEIDEELRCLLE